MPSRAWIEIDLDAVARNAAALGNHAGVPIMPMIKADAYGLGAVQVARSLEALDPLAYGVATVAEGEELRAAGIDRSILVFTPLATEDLGPASDARLTPTLGASEDIDAWKLYGNPYHLSIDTGMSRAGVAWRDLRSIIAAVTETPPAGAFTHFHSPGLDDSTMNEQLGRFRDAIALLPARPPVLHTDSSAAIVRHGPSEWDAVRPGIFMYGVGSGKTAALQPESVVKLEARVVDLRWVEPGDTVSYDATFIATGRRLIATVAAGYADGYPRGASGKGRAIVRKQSAPIAGRVTMDMIMIDVTDTGADVGDVVTLIGENGAGQTQIDVASVADVAGISPYELLTGLRNRIERIYKGGQQ